MMLVALHMTTYTHTHTHTHIYLTTLTLLHLLYYPYFTTHTLP
jgi:hypothetical protein